MLSWERAISLIDMALYMAKLHGRNCAYGIRGLRQSDEESLASIERDFEKAWENGMVDLHMLPGPDIDAYAASQSAGSATAVATDPPGARNAERADVSTRAGTRERASC